MTLLDVMVVTELQLKIDAHDKFIKDMDILDSRIDKEALANLLVKECGAMTPVYQDVYGFWWNNKLWYDTNADVINHMVDTMHYEYSPIHNYDMDEGIKEKGSSHTEGIKGTTEDYNKDNDGSDIREYRSTENEKLGGTDTLKHNYNSDISDNGGGDRYNVNTRNLTTTTSVSAFSEDKVSAYNEDLYQPDKTHTDISSTTEHQTGTVDDDGEYHNRNKRERRGDDTDETKYGKTKVTTISDDVTANIASEHEEGIRNEVTTDSRDGNTTGESNRLAFGSTGIYAKQDMIKKERDIALFNIYEFICKKYRKDNFYCIY